MLLVPSDPLRPRHPDEHFAAEAEAAREAGVAVALVDHDALCRNGAEAAVQHVPTSDEPALYRGWMLRSEQYEAFERALGARGLKLRTTAAQFRRAHELPGWCDALTRLTPESVWTASAGEADFRAACANLGAGAAVLRDYTKSMKHYWHEAAYIPDIADADAAWRVARRFLELREDAFVGGFVLRRFERFASNEVRTWWRDGECVLVSVHPDTAGELTLEPDLSAVAPRVAALGLPFVSVDLAQREDGVWRVIELGDGQVSDRPRSVAAAAFLRAVRP